MNAKDKGCIDHFDNKSKEWSTLYNRPNFKDRLNVFLQELQSVLPAPARILDYGCGAGVISFAIAEKGYEVVGVDGATGMIEAAELDRRRNNIDNVSFEVDQSNGKKISDNSFDAIVCSSVIEYVEDDKKLLEDLIRIIRPGGWLLFSVPHSHSLIGQLEDILVRIGLRGNRQHNADVFYANRRYNISVLRNFLKFRKMSNFSIKYYEIPKLGRVGVFLARLQLFGIMALVKAQKLQG